MFRFVLRSAALFVSLCGFSGSAAALDVYMFKGAGDFSFVSENMHFSRGLNKMAETLKAEGIHSEVRRFGAVDDAMASIRKRRPGTIAFVGHSMGALTSMKMARQLKNSGVEIVYMALLDIPGPVGVAGENVAKVENYFTINPVYGKLTNVHSHPDAQNIHVPGYIHNRLDDAPRVQNGILRAIRKIHAREQRRVDTRVYAPRKTDNAKVPRPTGKAGQASAASLATRHRPVIETGADPNDAWANLRTLTLAGGQPRIDAPRIDTITTGSVLVSKSAQTGYNIQTYTSLPPSTLKAYGRNKVPEKDAP